MYGDLGFTTLYDTETGSPVPDSTKQAFLRNGKVFRYESRQRKIRPSARLLLSAMLLSDRAKSLVSSFGKMILQEYRFLVRFFCGSYDVRWGREGNLVKRVSLLLGAANIEVVK